MVDEKNNFVKEKLPVLMQNLSGSREKANFIKQSQKVVNFIKIHNKTPLNFAKRLQISC